MMRVGVEATFSPNGAVQVRRVQIGGKWQTVGQGRQWVDKNGRHVLVMLPHGRGGVRQLSLRPDTLIWELEDNSRVIV